MLKMLSSCSVGKLFVITIAAITISAVTIAIIAAVIRIIIGINNQEPQCWLILTHKVLCLPQFSVS
jgi:hypothetical protein